MLPMFAAALMSLGQCCGAQVEKQVTQPIINNNIVTPSPNSCKSCQASKSFLQDIVDEVRSIEGNAGSLGGYDSDTDIDVHVRIRSETHTHDQNHDLVVLSKQVGFKDHKEDK